ncbi:MAG TPA: peptide ABC transporter substrate-binding protein [Candidatus Fimiplasma intestinipullorum]|uniref:Peptide ABC transporter substrate-binding protein n=1 Tax=Candidatus Fimiplasma intestinipullorum TaxID=2840825 RepID=A0A9D1HNH9_9FIRM|nr:peptide ABC transporter substrate-binding protein [Candidatus Fimiplasma intestinipullorum]
MKKIAIGMLAASLLLCACGNREVSYDPKVYKEYALTGSDFETLNYLYSYSSADLGIVANIVDGLVEADEYGNLVPSLAKSWEHNEDYSVWTFTLRDDLKWLDSSKQVYAEVTADDFVFAAEYVLDPANVSLNVNSYLPIIDGAQAYYDAKVAGEAVDFSMVGIRALDEKTIQYTMKDGKGVPYFPSVLTYTAFYPANRAYVESLDKNDDGTPKFGLDKDHVLYCGAFIIDELTRGSIRVFSKNEQYWDQENVHFDTVEVQYYKDKESVYEAFTRGEASYAPLVSSQAKNLYDQGSENLIQTELQFTSYVLFMNNHVSYDENVNLALSNENFRRSLFYGIDRDLINELENPINPESIEAFSFSARGFVTAPDGTDYLDLGNSKQFQTSQFDLAKAEQFKQLAVEELSAQGVTFPIDLTFAVVAGDETAATRGRLIQEAIEALGTDYVTCRNQEYMQSTYAQDRAEGKFALVLGGWTADYADPINNLTSVSSDGTMNQGLEIGTVGMSHWNYPEMDTMLQEADRITDLEERYTAFANIEAWLNEHAYYIPIYQKGGTYEVTTVNNYTKKRASAGIDQFKWKGIVAYDHVITVDENAAFKEAWEANRHTFIMDEQ